jgi:hypothetical protein
MKWSPGLAGTNRFYIGEAVFKGEVLKGEQPAILDRALFDAVQAAEPAGHQPQGQVDEIGGSSNRPQL